MDSSCTHVKYFNLTKFSQKLKGFTFSNALKICQDCDQDLKADVMNFLPEEAIDALKQMREEGLEAPSSSFGFDFENLASLEEAASHLDDTEAKLFEKVSYYAKQDPSVLMCLQCGYHGCLKGPKHCQVHFEEAENGKEVHCLFFDVFSKDLHCLECETTIGDQITATQDPEERAALESFLVGIQFSFERFFQDKPDSFMDFPEVDDFLEFVETQRRLKQQAEQEEEEEEESSSRPSETQSSERQQDEKFAAVPRQKSSLTKSQKEVTRVALKEVDIETIHKNLQNLSLFFVKQAVGAKNTTYNDELGQADEVFQEINDFVLCERIPRPIGKTCYLQANLIALNSCRRFVLSYLMRDPFPFSEESMSMAVRDFFTDYRQVQGPYHEYDDFLESLAQIKPEQYEDESVMGDSLESFLDVLNFCIDEEVEVHRLKHRQRLLAIKGRFFEDLSYQECLQKSAIFKSFGFRTITMTGCLNCKYATRRINFNLHLDLPVQFDSDIQYLNSRAATLFFNLKSTLSMEKILSKVSLMPKKGLLATLFPCCYKPLPEVKKKVEPQKKKDKEDSDTKSLIKPNSKVQVVKVKDANGEEYEVQMEEENSRINSTPLETNEVNNTSSEKFGDDIAQEYDKLELIEMDKINSENPNPHECFVYRLQNKFVEMKGISKQFAKKDDSGLENPFIEEDLLGLPLDIKQYSFFEPIPPMIFDKKVRRTVRIKDLLRKTSQIHHFKDSKNLYQCPNCNKIAKLQAEASGTVRYKKEESEFIQRTLLFDIPETLVINLKRYTYKNKSFLKDHTRVQIKKTLYMDDYMIHRVQEDNSHILNSYHEYAYSDLDTMYENMYDKKYKYTLFGVIAHLGESGAGHYVTYINFRYEDTQHWILYNGDKHCQVLEQTVLTAPGMCQLFYERDDSWQYSCAYDLIDVTLKNQAKVFLEKKRYQENLDKSLKDLIRQEQIERKSVGIKGPWKIPGMATKSNLDTMSMQSRVRRQMTQQTKGTSKAQEMEGLNSRKLFAILNEMEQVEGYPNMQEIIQLRKMKQDLDNTIRIRKRQPAQDDNDKEDL